MKARTGTLVGLLCSLAIVSCGGQAGMDVAGKGRVTFALSASSSVAAAPTSLDASSKGQCPTLTSASVTFSSILARTLDGKLIDVTIDLPTTVDLMSLGTGKDVTLPAGFLPPGTYDQIVVVMTSLEVTLSTGLKIALTPPGGGWTAIVPVSQPFSVVEGQTTSVTLSFRRDLSFVCSMGKWGFRPEFEGSGDHGGGGHGD